MPGKTYDLVALAIEVIECGTKAVDTSTETVKVTRSGNYSLKMWAIDMLKLLPDDRSDALSIVKAHTPGGVNPDNRRRVGQLCGRYYRRLEQTDLLTHGKRFLRIMG